MFRLGIKRGKSMSFVVEYPAVKEYIEQRFGGLKEYIIECKSIERRKYNINFSFSDELYYCDEEGYPCPQIKVLARYTASEENIAFNVSELRNKLQDIKQEIDRRKYALPYDMLFDCIDIIILHELAHVYQYKILERSMKRNDADIENEADKFAIDWYRDISVEEGKTLDNINKVIEIYNKNRENTNLF